MNATLPPTICKTCGETFSIPDAWAQHVKDCDPARLVVVAKAISSLVATVAPTAQSIAQ